MFVLGSKEDFESIWTLRYGVGEGEGNKKLQAWKVQWTL